MASEVTGVYVAETMFCFVLNIPLLKLPSEQQSRHTYDELTGYESDYEMTSSLSIFIL
jgi:hypothetical protein